MKRILLYSAAIVAALSSCSSDDEYAGVGDKFAGNVVLSAGGYEFEDGTRTSLTNTGSAIEFAWQNGEAIGVFPIAPTTNYQAKQVIETNGEGTSAVFNGAGWALLRGNTYAAYSPCNEDMGYRTPYSAVPVDMTGQVQKGNGSLAHVGDKYDFMYASASVPTEGGVNFEFYHVGSIIVLELTMPEYAQWTNAVLTAESPVFVTSATMNVSDGSLANKQMSNSISLDLDNVSGKNLTLYLAALPTATGSVTLKVKKSNNEELSAILASKTLVAGHAYKWKYSWVHAPAGVEAVDLGLSVKWANMNVGATSPTDFGTYFAWGEIEGAKMASDGSVIPAIMDGNSLNPNYIAGKNRSYMGLWDNYKWYDGTNYYKYTLETKTTLDAEDDAATMNWDTNWRTPTYKEQKELFDNCYWVYTSNYNNTGKTGYIIYKAKSEKDKGVKIVDGASPNEDYDLSDTHIFLVMAGGLGANFGNIGTNFSYMSSTLYSNNNNYVLVAYPGEVLDSPSSSRYSCHTIRPVCQ